MKRLTKKQKEVVTETFRKLRKVMSLDNALLKIASIILNYQLRDKRK
jgi:hypothetical protein